MRLRVIHCIYLWHKVSPAMPLRIISGLTHTARYSHTALQLQQGHIQGED